MLAHCLAHGAWTLIFATAALYYLEHAESSADINTWLVRVLWLWGLGVLGSLGIQISWWGSQRIARLKFWASWLAVTTLCNVLALPVAMLLIY